MREDKAFLPLIVFFLFLLLLVPTRPNPHEEKIPNIAGETNWGMIEQQGNKFTIHGNPFWNGDGTIDKDGKIYINWFNLPDGIPAEGVYQLKDGQMHGYWDYSNRTGDSLTRPDVIFRKVR